MLDSGAPGITVSPTLWWWRSNREGDQAEIYLEDDPNCTFVLTDTPLTKDLRPFAAYTIVPESTDRG